MKSTEGELRIFRRESPVAVLGPGRRAVVWVQGCNFACPNCIVPESWDDKGGESASVSELADWVVASTDVDGLTISGGEPMLQAGSLSLLIDQVKSRRDMGVVCYTGYTHEYLLSRGSPDQLDLLQRIDLLIDGVYLAGQHRSLLWRGSANQRLIQISTRYADYISARQAEQGDVTAGMEVVMDSEGGIGYAGVPAKPGFRDEFIAGMRTRGIRLSHELTGDINMERANL